MNRLTIIGHLGADPEKHVFPSGDEIAKFSVAVGVQYKDHNGKQVDETEWFNNCEAKGQTAAFMLQYLRKGAYVYIEAHQKTDRWKTAENENRSTKKWMVTRVKSLRSAAPESQQTAQPAPAQQTPQQAAQQPAQNNGWGNQSAATSGDAWGNPSASEEVPF